MGFSRRRCKAKVAVALLLAVAAWSILAAAPALAAPIRGASSWSDTFDSRQGVKTFDGTRVSGGKLELLEPPPVDLGGTVPDESAVYSVLGTTLGLPGHLNNVYCGTGQKGHLVEFSPDQLYQERYHGPPHWGVTNTRGQAVTPVTSPSSTAQEKVLALTECGGKVYGGTGPDGHLFSFEPNTDPANAVERPCEDLGKHSAGGVEIFALETMDGVVYVGSENGNLYSYTPPAGPIALVGAPGGASGQVRSLVASGSTLYLGYGDGQLYSYTVIGGFSAALGPLGNTSPLLSLADMGGTVYVGSADGHVYSYNGAFTDLLQPSGAADPVNALAVSGATVYIGSENGRVYTYEGGGPVAFFDYGEPPGAGGAPVYALSMGADGRLYGGTGDDGSGKGRLFRLSGDEDHGSPAVSPVTGICYPSSSNTIYLGTGGGNVYSYTGRNGALPVFNNLGQPAGGVAVNAMASGSGTNLVYIGAADGQVYSYTDGGPGGFSPALGPPGNTSPVKSMAFSGGTLFVGLENGDLWRYSGTFTNLGQPGGAEPVNGLAVSGSTLYIASNNRHVYSCPVGGATFTDLWPAMCPTAVTSVAVTQYTDATPVTHTMVVAGSAGGHIYSHEVDTPPGFDDLGDCGSQVNAVSAGTGSALAGTSTGHLWLYDWKIVTASRKLADLGVMPGGAAVRSLCRVVGPNLYATSHVFGGTDGGELFSYDDSFFADMGAPVREQDMAFCMTYDSNTGLLYAGTYSGCYFLVIDPSTGAVVNRGRPVDGERELDDIIVATGGTVYGATYGGTNEVHNPAGGRVFSYDPVTMAFTDLGHPPGDPNWWVTSLVEGPLGVIYGGTSNSVTALTEGRFFSYDGSLHDLGVPLSGEGTRALVRVGDDIYGGTWKIPSQDSAHLYKYNGVIFTDLGEPPVPPSAQLGMTIMTLCVSGSVIYGGEENGYAFAYDTAGAHFHFARKPITGSNAVPTVLTGGDGTIWCGTISDFAESGHLVNYDPSLDYFRDVGPVVAGEQRVRSLAMTGTGALFGDASSITGTDSHLFRLDTASFDTGDGHNAVSVDVAPGLRGMDMNVFPPGPPWQESVGALCGAPGGVHELYGGTSNSSAATDARLFRYSVATGQVTDLGVALAGHNKVLSLTPGSDGYVYGGTGDDTPGESAHLFRYDPLGGVTDLGAPLAGAKGVFALTATGSGKVFGGTGDKPGEPCHFFEYDPVLGIRDKGACGAGQGRLLTLVTASDGNVYGGTGTSPGETTTAQFVKYDTSLQVLTVTTPAELGGEQSIYDVVSGPGGKLYLGTGPSGRLFSRDPGGTTFTNEGSPCGAGSAVLSLAATADRVYGAAGTSGNLFRFTPGSGFTDMGPLTYANTGAPASATDNLGKPWFGTSSDLGLLRFDPSCRFQWGTVTYTKDASAPVTDTRVDVLSESGSVLKPNVSSGENISDITDTGITLRGDLKTTVSTVSSYIDDWQVTWTNLPGIDEVTPAQSYRGDTISIWGYEFGAVQGGSTVTVGGAPATVTGWQPGLVQVTVPEGAANGQVVVTVGVNQSNTGSFQLCEPPQISSLGPSAACAGDYVQVAGSWFLAWEPESAVYFNGAPATEYQSWADGSIVVKVPAGATSGDVTVEVNGHTSNGAAFQLCYPPHIDSVSPATVFTGDIVEVRGSSFRDSRDYSYVSFNGMMASDYPAWSDTLIGAKVPQGATTGDVTVYVAGHTSNAGKLTVYSRNGPSVVITRPAEGSNVNGKTTIEADVHGENQIEKVEFFVDGGSIGTDTSAPYTCEWDPGEGATGQFALTARATDQAGLTGEGRATVRAGGNTPTIAKRWYFAEGCTDYGFETWVLVQNPNQSEAVATVKYLDESGKSTTRTFLLPGDSRLTVNAADAVPRGSFSIEVESDLPVISERSMYWNGRVEGHDTIGSDALSGNWYFAEGCTDWGFETYVLVGNPGESAVNARITYMFTDGTTHGTDHVLAPRSRLTVDAQKEVGEREFSIGVEADGPGVVAERSMYYGNRRCGTGTIGCLSPSNTWYLSEGSTDWGFETWVLLQRPGAGDAHATVTFRKRTGETVERRVTVKANSRFTINVWSEVGVTDVSTSVTSDLPLVAERSMYWRERQAGHCSIGAMGSSATWYFAEGCTDYGFETWLLLDNPADHDVAASLTFMKNGGRATVVDVRVPAHSRASFDAGVFVPRASFSTKVSGAEPLMAERAMYWNNRGGGTGSIGAR